MKVNFIGNYQSGYVGETADEVMLTQRLEEQGHHVTRVPRDIWKAFVDENANDDTWVLPEEADFNIICKWHHFNNGKYVEKLRKMSGAPVFYWTWDFMYDYTSQDFIDWHKAMAEASDVLLTNEGGLIPAYEASLINAYYFPFDVADENLTRFEEEYRYDVSFFGSHLHQGDRIEFLKKINGYIPITIFSWNYEEWKKEGFIAHPAVYGEDFNQKVAQSKICLQMSVDDHTWGYWSNRVGKTLLAGGFLLARYAPGMELFLKDGVAYFNTPKEAIKKIDHFLDKENRVEYQLIKARGEELGLTHFSSAQRIRELVLFAQNYINRKGGI